MGAAAQHRVEHELGTSHTTKCYQKLVVLKASLSLTVNNIKKKTTTTTVVIK